MTEAAEAREAILREISNSRMDLSKMRDDVAEVRTIVAGSSATMTALATNVIDLRNELQQMRIANHTRFDKIHEFFQNDEKALEDLRSRMSTVEHQISFVFKAVTIAGTIIVVISGWFFSGGELIAKWFGK